MEDEFGPDDLLSDSESSSTPSMNRRMDEKTTITSREDNRMQEYIRSTAQPREDISGTKSG